MSSTPGSPWIRSSPAGCDTDTLRRVLQALRTIQRAIDALTQHRPDLVLTDFRLPDGDGLQVINQVRQTLPQKPVIVMTAYHVPGMEEMVRRAGAADYSRKPFALKDLRKAIDAATQGPIP